MPRSLQILTTAAGGLLALGVVFWLLAFRVGRLPPNQMSVAELRGPIEVTWHEGWDATISNAQEEDLPLARGVIDVVGKPWLTFLMRQAATGRLASWYGDAVLPLDEHIALLNIVNRAKLAVRDLSPDARAFLDRYAHGVNAGLATRRVRFADGLAELGANPEPWEAWHSVAIEQMLAWLSAERPARSGDPDVERLFNTRSLLGDLLGFEGGRHSAAWVQGDTLFARLVYGSSGVPHLTTVVSGSSNVSVSPAGVPYSWFGADSERTYLVLPRGRIVADSGVQPSSEFASYLSSDGSINVIEQRMAGDTLGVGSLRLVWSGFRPASDASAWLAMEAGINQTFQLIPGTGLRWLRGESSWIGPEDEVTVESALAIAAPRDFAEGLVANLRSPGTGELQSNHAMDRLRTWLQSADSSPASGSVLEYARNWDGTFSTSSIGAVIYHAWDTMDVRSNPTDDLARLSDRLNSFIGSDLRTWRWEQSDSVLLHFPGYPPKASGSRFSKRYLPVYFPRSGHPTTRSWGTAPKPGQPAAPGAWEGRVPLGQPEALIFRRPSVDFDAFLGRSSGSPVSPFARSSERPAIAHTLLKP